RVEDLVLGDRLTTERLRIERAVAVVLRRHLGQRRRGDTVVVHVLVDLHAEELGGHELTVVAVPRRHVRQRGVRLEGAARVLVDPDGDADVAGTGAQRVGRRLDGARTGGARVEHVAERDPGQTEVSRQRVGLPDLPAAAERTVHVAPLDSRVL